MSFTKHERDTLGQLSLVCFGTESKWQKMYDAGAFNKGIEGEKPDYEELLEGLIGAKRWVLMSRMSPGDLQSVIAYQFLTQDAPLSLSLVGTEIDGLDELLAKLPADKVAKIQEYRLATEGAMFDVVSFVSECVYLQSNIDTLQVGLEGVKAGIVGIFAEYEHQLLESLKRNNLK